MGKALRISFLGDMLCKMPETLYANKGRDKYDYDDVFAGVKKYLSKADYVVGNLETPIAGKECGYTYTQFPSIFNTPTDFALAAKKAGVDLFTTANNHALDRGIIGLQKTIENLDAIGAEHVGTQITPYDKRTFVKHFENIRISFLSYTYGMNSNINNVFLDINEEHYVNFLGIQKEFKIQDINKANFSIKKLIIDYMPKCIFEKRRTTKIRLDCGDRNTLNNEESKRFINKMLSDIEEAKKTSDITILCLHIGGQYNSTIGPYTSEVIRLCREKGCNAIIANHPHCVLESGIKDNCFQAFALGNFCSTPEWGYHVPGVYADYSVIVNLNIDTDNKKIDSITYTVTKCVRNGLHSKVFIVKDLYENASGSEKTSLKHECQKVIERFLGKKINSSQFEVKEEYDYPTY